MGSVEETGHGGAGEKSSSEDPGSPSSLHL